MISYCLSNFLAACQVNFDKQHLPVKFKFEIRALHVYLNPDYTLPSHNHQPALVSLSNNQKHTQRWYSFTNGWFLTPCSYEKCHPEKVVRMYIWQGSKSTELCFLNVKVSQLR